MDSVIKGLKCVCGYCGLFVSEKEFQIYAIDDCLIRNSIISRLLTYSHINCCVISDNDIYLCLICSSLLSLDNQPKIEILNGFACMDCQSYPPVLANLFMTKKVTIACAHPVVSILKLRFSKAFNPAVYSCIKGHTVLLPQNPAPLLTLLPFPTLALYNVIRIV